MADMVNVPREVFPAVINYIKESAALIDALRKQASAKAADVSADTLAVSEQTVDALIRAGFLKASARKAAIQRLVTDRKAALMAIQNLLKNAGTAHSLGRPVVDAAEKQSDADRIFERRLGL